MPSRVAVMISLRSGLIAATKIGALCLNNLIPPVEGFQSRPSFSNPQVRIRLLPSMNLAPIASPPRLSTGPGFPVRASQRRVCLPPEVKISDPSALNSAACTYPSFGSTSFSAPCHTTASLSSPQIRIRASSRLNRAPSTGPAKRISGPTCSPVRTSQTLAVLSSLQLKIRLSSLLNTAPVHRPLMRHHLKQPGRMQGAQIQQHRFPQTRCERDRFHAVL